MQAMTIDETMRPKSPEPTAVGAGRFAVHAMSRQWAAVARARFSDAQTCFQKKLDSLLKLPTQ